MPNIVLCKMCLEDAHAVQFHRDDTPTIVCICGCHWEEYRQLIIMIQEYGEAEWLSGNNVGDNECLQDSVEERYSCLMKYLKRLGFKGAPE